MNTLSSYSSAEFGERLRRRGVYLKTGAFTTRIQTTIPSVAESLALLYADYSVLEDAEFADFHVRMASPSNMRRWFKPQVNFFYDGMTPFKPLPLPHAYPMFEWGLNWCVASKANRYLIIHAAVIEKDGYAVILPAPPGSGKSTLCAALVCRGWRLLSDELALIRPEDAMLMPLPRPISLKNASIDVIRNYEPSTVFSKPVADTTKGTVAHLKVPSDSVTRSAEFAIPAWIVFPKYEAGSEAKLEPLSRARSFMNVAENAFNYSLLGKKGFDTLASVIDASMSYQFTYSRLDDAIDVFSSLKPLIK
jgi:HprK-related kinase A